MTLNNIIEADILSTCNALGSEIKGVYEKGTDCTECLKDILRHLKRDSDEHAVLRFLGSIRLLQTDLLPIIKQYDKDKEIFDFTLRILVALTNPALLLYNEDLPEDKISRNVYLQLISYLQDYKNAFIDVSVWNIFYEHLKGLLKIRPKERSSNENLFIERIIILIRNVLHVPPDDSIHKITDDDLNPHDKILQCLHESKINTLLLFMAANEEEHQYCLHILEIVSLMFREHTPQTLASSNETRSNAEKENDLNVLLAARQREQNLKLQKFQSMCKARFNGVYCVKNMKSISDKDYITHRLVERPEDVKFDEKKDARRKPKNKMRAADIDNSRHSTLSIRLFLKKFCVEFLKTYNKIMVSVKRELLRNITEEHDDTYYLWAINYFMEFNRLHNFQPALVSETVTMQSFHHIQTQITNYQEMMLTDKKKTMFWAKRMQLGISAYKELLETLKEMEKSEDEIIKSSADALIGNVFYVIEYREMLLSLISHYHEVKFPLSYLAKLVECAHLFLKMLENHSKKHSDIVVQKKQRKKHRKKKKKPITANELSNVDDQLNEQWDVVTSELSQAVQGHRPIPNVTPFDGASAMSFEEQKIEAIYKIREALIANQPFEAVGLLRAARELWPEGDSFGSVDIEPEPEFLVLREIHFSNLTRPTENNFIETGDVDSDDSDEEAETMPALTEQKLAVDEVYEKYASYKVVQPCSLLLANYRKNKPQTNLALIKLFHRIAWHCKMHGLFFQSSIFLTFQKIFHDPDVNRDPIIKEFYRFAKFIMQKFFVVAENNKKVFVELLFWKGNKEAYELEEGYGTSDSKLKGWTEEEEEELKSLFEEFKNTYIEGQDVADIILANLNPTNRTKKQVISALKRLCVIKKISDLKPEKRKEWLEEEIIDLQELFGVYKNTHNVMDNILDKLQIKRPRKVVMEKLLELNLIEDKNELKSRKKGKGSKFMDSDNNSGESEDNLSNEPLLNNDSSGDEDEINFFKNLEAERYSEDRNDMLGMESTQSENKTVSQIWEEHEVMKLTSLFQENHESDNILDILLSELPRNRRKKEVVEKLLELGLIKDKNEINKKKRNLKRTVEKKKKNSKKMPRSRYEGSNSDPDEYDSSLDSDFNKILKPARKRKLELQLLESSDEDVPLNNISTLNNLKGHKNMPQKPKQKISKLWEEKEIIELNQLFQKYKDSDDVISAITKDLSFKQTKKSITEKLLEIGLIKDKSEVKKKKLLHKGRLSEEAVRKKNFVWGEKEIIELNQLFLDHKDSEDILSNIMKRLTFKQTKNNIIKKLIEIGLIKDKSEIMSNSSLNRKSSSKPDGSINQKTIKRKKYSEEWSEEEVLQLTQLYHKYKDGHDIVTNIFQGLTMKRQKQQIIEKLLEVRLIKDRTEVTGKKKNLKHFESEQNITKKAVLDDNSQISADVLYHSSDDENVPLTHVAAKNDNIDKADTSLQDYEISLHDKIPVIEKDVDDRLPLKSNFLNVTDGYTSSNDDALSSRPTKRKRLIINSDDSSDDDGNANLTNELVGKDSQEQVIQTYTVPKLQKKKMRLLDDSDDSE